MLAIRRPRNPIGWLFLTAGAGLALSAFALGYTTHAVLVAHASWPMVRFFGWVGKWVWPIAFTMLIFLLLTFPDGALRSRTVAADRLARRGRGRLVDGRDDDRRHAHVGRAVVG